MKFLTAVHTDTGVTKGVNQDAVLMETAATDYGSVLFSAVCDGLGGLVKGEVASSVLIKACSDWFHKEFPAILYENMIYENLKESWMKLLTEQNREIYQYGLKRGISLGTTLSALLLADGNYYIIHVGDSRVYYMKDKIMQLTTDHTFIQREIAAGRMTADEAGGHPNRNMLLQCVGAGNTAVPDFYRGRYEEDSVFMLCSDGFRHKVSEEELFQQLRPDFMTSEEKMQKALLSLTGLSKTRKEKDNISAALVRVCRGGVYA